MAWPSTRPLRSRSWALAYGVTSMLLGLLPAVAALPALAIVAVGVAGTASPAEATSGALLMVAPATVAYLVTYAALVVVGVRLLGIGMAEGFHPVHSRAGWQVWATERLMGMARTGLFPLYSSLFTAAWLRLLGARIGRDVEASTVIALPKMTTVADGAFLADDTMVGTYELSGGWMHVAPSRVGKQAFLGNSGMTAPGRSVPDRGLVGVLSATPRKAKKGSSWLGLPPMPLRRAVERGDTSRTFHPPRHLKIARGLIELCRMVPVMCSAALAVLVVGQLMTIQAGAGFVAAAVLAGPLLLAAGVVAAGVDDGDEVAARRPVPGRWSIRCGARSCGATSWPTRSSRCWRSRGWSGTRAARPSSPRGCGAWARASGAACGWRRTGCPSPTSCDSATARRSTGAVWCRPTCSMIGS